MPGTDLRLGRVVDGEHRHRPGWDATFSAPKSVSLEALLYDSKAVMRAHDAAVRATLDWMEGEFLQTRGYDPATGRRPRVKADGLVAATFRHVASRNNDPQLHTHAVIANMTRNMAGEWRSVEPTALQRNRRLIGAWYRNDLARRLDEMGYVLVSTEVGGLPSFELAGYSPAMLAAFSTRRRDILSYMAEKGWNYSARTAQAATFHTRKRKDEPGHGELAAMWKARAEALGLSRDPEAVRLDRTERSFTRPPPRFTPLEAVWQAVDHLEERHAVFPESDLLAAALGRAPGRHTHGELETEIACLKRDGHLVEAGEGALTTRRTLRAEKEVVRRMKRGVGAARPLADEEDVSKRLSATVLTDGQKEAVRLVLLSLDPTVAVQGFAGTGKTRMLNEVAGLAGDRRVFGLAPSAAAARVLAVEGGIGATTLQWLLTRYGAIAEGTASEKEIERARETFRDTVVVVDESSMVGTVQMRDLQRILEPLGVARLVLVGDSLQLRSVEAGQPFRLLQRAGMATARMDDVIRQRSVDLKAAVVHMVAGDPALAVDSIASDVRELPAEALAGTAARLWLSLPPDARKGTIILAPTHEMREEINAVVRRGLADEGVLGRRSVEIGRLVDRRLTRMHAADPESYRPGDVAVANRDVYGLGDGEAWTVAGVEDGEVRLRRRGEHRAFRPSGNAARNVSLCEARPLSLRSGDEIVWTRNIRRLKLINGERATVERITRDRVHVRTESGRAIRFAADDDDLRHVDHAWSSTVHRAQGITRNNVIAVLDSASMMSDRAMLYVEMSRARDGFVLLTDDTEQLVSRLEREGQSVSSALEAAGEAPWLQPDLDMKVAEKPLLWPVLADWRAHVERAHEMEVRPFHLDGCEALIARMRALAAKEALPGELASVLEEHRPFAGDRARVTELAVLDAGACGEARAASGGSSGERRGGDGPSGPCRMADTGGNDVGRGRADVGGQVSLRRASGPRRGGAGAARRTVQGVRPRVPVRQERRVAALGVAGAGERARKDDPGRPCVAHRRAGRRGRPRRDAGRAAVGRGRDRGAAAPGRGAAAARGGSADATGGGAAARRGRGSASSRGRRSAGATGGGSAATGGRGAATGGQERRGVARGAGGAGGGEDPARRVRAVPGSARRAPGLAGQGSTGGCRGDPDGRGPGAERRCPRSSVGIGGRDRARPCVRPRRGGP